MKDDSVNKDGWTAFSAADDNHRHISANRFLVVLLLPVFAFLLLFGSITVSSLLDIRRDIKELEQTHIPGMLESNRAADNIAILRNEIDIIYTTADLDQKRRSTLKAEIILSDFVFESTEAIRDFGKKSVALPRLLSQARTTGITLAEELNALEFKLLATAALLQNADGKVRVVMDARDMIAKISPTRKFARTYALCRSSALPPELKETCTAFQNDVHTAEDAFAAITGANKDAEAIWRVLDAELRALDSAMSTMEVKKAYAHFNKMKSEAIRLDNIICLMLVLLVVLILCVVVATRQHLLKPITKAAASLDNINTGQVTPLLPRVRITELQKLMDFIPRLSDNMMKLTVWSERLAQEKRKFEDLSLIDGLTGVSNRRSFDMRLARNEKSHRGQSLAILMIDVDKFKNYNDTLGHQAGDKCLSAVSHAMKATLYRRNDTLYRYGGEEFTVILENVSADQAMSIAMRLREAVYKLQLPHPSSPAAPYVTVSIGVSVAHRGHFDSCVEVVTQADKALYVAKIKGRNRIHMFSAKDAEEQICLVPHHKQKDYPARPATTHTRK